MSRTPARFTQADLTRVLRAVRDLGMGARVDLVKGTVDILAKPIEMRDEKENEHVPITRDFTL